MKKLTACFLLLIMVLTVLSGCVRNNNSDNNEESVPYIPEPDTERMNVLKAKLPYIIMDGSTSTIPLETGIRAALLGIDKEEAEKQVKHSTTYESFFNLVTNKSDIIFTVPISQQQSDYAASQNFEYETIPIAMEGFVFVVNKDNPVESLTQQQIKDIYSGKITNWKDVGGNDAEIVAYQRNSNSGSQNYMVAFMGDTQLMNPKTEARPATMSGLIDAVASYDNGIHSIGYSVYSYAAEMYVAASNVKFIKVDGIQPSKDTMADGSYPLLSYNYAIINKKTPEDSPIRTLIDWILSTAGQNAVSESGYIPVAKINTSLEQTIVKPLKSLGTGPEKPADFKMPSTNYYLDYYDYLKYDQKPADNIYQTENYNYRIEGLKNKALQNEINNFIKQAEADANAIRAEAENYYHLYYDSGNFYGVSVDTSCMNGYLSVVLSLTYDNGYMDATINFYKPVSAVWDLYTGKRMSFTDMFWKDEDFIATVNSNIRRNLDSYTRDPNELKGEFWALPENFDTFSLNSVYFPSREGIFVHGVNIGYKTYCEEMLVTSQQRDMKDIWEDTSIIQQGGFYYSYLSHGIEVKYDNDITFWMLDAETLRMDKAVADKISNYMKKQIEETITAKTLDAKFGKEKYSFDFEFDGVSFYVLGNNYVFYSGYLPITYHDGEDKSIQLCVSAVFDFKTGDRLNFDDILSDGWENDVRWSGGTPYNIKDLSLVEFNVYYYDYNYTKITCYNQNKYEIVDLYVPKKYLQFSLDN